MKIRLITMVVTAITLMMFAGLGQAAAAQYQDGVHYITIENAKATVPGSVEVVEAFSYMCTHCATFEPYIQSWQKRLPEGVKFVRYPVVFGRDTWELYARAYVTADVMGVADKAHGPLMDKLWKERKILKSMDELAAFYAEFGVDPAGFVATSKSFAVDAKMRRDQSFLMEAGVNGTPSMVVNGKYLVAASTAVANYDQLLAVVDHLVALELAAAGPASVADSIEAAVESQEGDAAQAAEEAATAAPSDEG